MAIFEVNQEGDNYSVIASPLVPSSIAIGIGNETERWVGVLFGATHSELLNRAVQRYVEGTERWKENRSDSDLNQERRLAFIELLRTISYGCEDLAHGVAQSHTEH